MLKMRVLQRAYEFGPFRLLPDSRTLLHNGKRVELQERAFATLYAIAQRLGKTISGETLLREVWGSLHYDPNNVFQQVKALRRALGEDESGQPYIRTISGQGYFIPGVSLRHVVLGVMVPSAQLVLVAGGALAVLCALAIWTLWPRQFELLPPANLLAMAGTRLVLSSLMAAVSGSQNKSTEAM
jgi:DNA-binding winged helix-turn-helix (wHTH) protein